jgi:hypothetical protein
MWAIEGPGAKGFWRGQPRPQAPRCWRIARTEDDLTIIGGKPDQLVGRIQERYGVAKDEAERQAKTWVNRM